MQNSLLFDNIQKQVYENPKTTRTELLVQLDSLNPEDKISKLKLLKFIGTSYILETKYSQAIKYFNEALKLAKATNSYTEIAVINSNLGGVYNEVGSYKKAFSYFTEALSYYELSENKEKKVGTLNNIGITYLHLSNYDKALKYFKDAMNQSKESNDSILITTLLNNIASCYNRKNIPDSALHYLNQTIEISEKLNAEYTLSVSYELMGMIYMSTNQIDNANKAYLRSIKLAQKTDTPYQLAFSKQGLAKVLLRQKHPQQALKVAFEAMKIATEQNNLNLISNAHHVLAEIYESIGDYKSGIFHYREYINNQQELLNQTVINQIYDLEVDNLNQLNATQELELEKKELAISKKNNLLLFTILIFILLFVGLYQVYLNHRSTQKLKLQEAIIDLTDKKSQAMQKAEIQERKRIGQELHDGLGQLLSIAGMNANVLKRKDVSQEKKTMLLESLIKSIDDAFNELRNISHNLAPSLLSECGLKGALKSISDRVNQSDKLSMSFSTFGLDKDLDTLIENTLFRTIQEIVNNTIKHANATSLFIQIAQGNEEITVMSEDNGCGFDSESIEVKKSHGLSHMRSRIENLNGTMYIDSSPNRGTIINILIPLKNMHDAKKNNQSINC